jgi:hypothetical protein
MQIDQHALARHGAEIRLQQIQTEIVAINRLVPDLQIDRMLAQGVSLLRHRRKQAQSPRKHTMSAAQRKAVSVRMRRYWQSRREAKAKSAAQPVPQPNRKHRG